MAGGDNDDDDNDSNDNDDVDDKQCLFCKGKISATWCFFHL